MEQPLADTILAVLYNAPGRKVTLADLCESDSVFQNRNKCLAVIRKLAMEGLVSRHNPGTGTETVYLLMKGELVYETGGWIPYMREKRHPQQHHINDHILILLILTGMFLLILVFVIWD